MRYSMRLIFELGHMWVFFFPHSSFLSWINYSWIGHSWYDGQYCGCLSTSGPNCELLPTYQMEKNDAESDLNLQIFTNLSAELHATQYLLWMLGFRRILLGILYMWVLSSYVRRGLGESEVAGAGASLFRRSIDSSFCFVLINETWAAWNWIAIVSSSFPAYFSRFWILHAITFSIPNAWTRRGHLRTHLLG